MMGLPLLAVSFIMKVIVGIFILCAAALVLIVLIQKGRGGGGIGGILGGGAAGGILGSKTGDFLTWVTVSLAGLFLLLAVIMVKFYKPTVSNFDVAPLQQQMPENSQQSGTGRMPAAEESDVNLLE
jgi:preprotein translocase subunit SecG